MKKGFVFVETLVVLSVVTVSIVSLYGVYLKISTDIEKREYYDNVSDLYKTNIVRNLININKVNEFIEINKNNCESFMDSKCTNILESLNIDNVYITDKKVSLILEDKNIDNTLKEYLKTINTSSNTLYIIINYKNNGHNYYASLKYKESNI